MIDALVLAGGSAKGLAPVSTKGLIDINGKPMVEYVVDALCRCGDIDRVCVVLPVEHDFKRFKEKVDVVVASGTFPEVIKAGIDFLGTKNQFLLVTSDIPLITHDAISDFLERCSAQKAEICYPIVRYGEAEKRFPGVKRTYVRLKDGRFTGGNIALVTPEAINKITDLLDLIYKIRKEPLKIAKVLGFSFLLRLIFGLLSISQLEIRVGQLTKSICAGIITPFIEVGIDVDKESDLQLVVSALAGDTDG